MKIGEMLIKESLITQEQFNEAIEIQKNRKDTKIGEILLELGYIDIDQFTKILDKQLKEQGLLK